MRSAIHGWVLALATSVALRSTPTRLLSTEDYRLEFTSDGSLKSKLLGLTWDLIRIS